MTEYLPPGFDPAKGAYPYTIVFDGDAYGPRDVIPAPIIADDLAAEGQLPQTLLALVHSPDRNRGLTMSAPFADFLAKELAPWVRKEYRGSSTRRRLPSPDRASADSTPARVTCPIFFALIPGYGGVEGACARAASQFHLPPLPRACAFTLFTSHKDGSGVLLRYVFFQADILYQLEPVTPQLLGPSVPTSLRQSPP